MNHGTQRTAALLKAFLPLFLLAACSSPPELAQVTCCTQRPVNDRAWVERKTLEHEEKLRLRTEARTNYIKESTHRTDEMQLVEELNAADDFVDGKDKVAPQEEPSTEDAPKPKRGLISKPEATTN